MACFGELSGSHCRPHFIYFGGASSLGNCGDHIGQVFHEFSFRSPGFSHFCYRLLGDLCDHRPWLILPLCAVGQSYAVEVRDSSWFQDLAYHLLVGLSRSLNRSSSVIILSMNCIVSSSVMLFSIIRMLCLAGPTCFCLFSICLQIIFLTSSIVSSFSFCCCFDNHDILLALISISCRTVGRELWLYYDSVVNLSNFK